MSTEYESLMVRGRTAHSDALLSECLSISPILAEVYDSVSFHFIEQFNGGACAIASAVIVLNALLFGRNKYDLSFTQPELMSVLEVNTIAPMNLRHGLTLDQCAMLLEKAFERYGGRAKGDSFVAVRIVRNLDAEVLEKTFRSDLENLCPTQYIIVNYLREIGAFRGGHFSPVSAVSLSSKESVYIADTSARAGGPHWLPIPFVARMMATLDSQARATRGYLVVTLLR